MKIVFFQMDRIIPSIFLVKIILKCVCSLIISSKCRGAGREKGGTDGQREWMREGLHINNYITTKTIS